MFYAVRFPKLSKFAIMLLFYDYFFRFESRKLENPHCFESERLNHAFYTHVSHKYYAEFTLFQDTKTLICYLAHFGKEGLNLQMRFEIIFIF